MSMKNIKSGVIINHIKARHSRYLFAAWDVFSHLLEVAVPTPFVTELPPTKTGQHLDAEQAVKHVIWLNYSPDCLQTVSKLKKNK